MASRRFLRVAFWTPSKTFPVRKSALSQSQAAISPPRWAKWATLLPCALFVAPSRATMPKNATRYLARTGKIPKT